MGFVSASYPYNEYNRSGFRLARKAEGINGETTTYYSIGDTGPAGGLVFYDKGSLSDGWRYLEVAPAITEWANKEWGIYGTTVNGADGITVGTGEQNTADMVTAQGTGSTYAAQLCGGLSYGGYDDWFLPSKDELSFMYDNLKVSDVGGFADYGYWSSSEYSSTNAWHQNFSFSNGQGNDVKDFNLCIRAVRAF